MLDAATLAGHLVPADSMFAFLATTVLDAATSGLRHALATGAAFAAAAAVLALATKNTREYPARHAAGTEQDQPQHAAGLETTMEIR